MNLKTCVLLVGLGLGFLLLTSDNASAQYYRAPAVVSVNIATPLVGVAVNGGGYYPYAPPPAVVVAPRPYLGPRPYYYGPRPYRPYRAHYPYRYW